MQALPWRIKIIVIDTTRIIIFDGGVLVRMLVRFQQLLPHGHGSELKEKEEYMERFYFDNV